ncbi:hypothetical protein H6G76_33410 [Nostoc sp. FACHB-152]|uniref:hypothetical protein n=1 Tax=unclassified Nostoc TaxID=2593658 RepID=UPI0016827A64|nr:MULTISPECIES: hypothetical protein [unclassified Nostoc]MBD2451935.1 hypothetical protein [Nostoc sp. FACHB-152]MBD2472572.1 hypothetical protein [Nostoc sp. FACHB-145]
MNIIQSQMQKYCLMGLMNVLMVGGAIASSGGYAFAQSQLLQRSLCIPSPTNLCNFYRYLYKDGGHSPAMEIDLILILYPQAIEELKREDPFAVQRLRVGDLATIQRLEQLAPGSTQGLQSSLPQVIPQLQHLNQLNPYLQQVIQQPQQLNQSVVGP